MSWSAVLDVAPSGFVECAGVVGGVAGSVGDGWTGLLVGLDGGVGMAGSDEVGARWGVGYDEMAGAALAATRGVVDAGYRVAGLVEQTGLNYAGAEAASLPGGWAGGSVPFVAGSRWAGLSGCLGSLGSAVGAGVSAPAGWSQVQAVVGWLWPDGDQGRLRAAGAQWRRSGDRLVALAGEVDAAAAGLAGQRAPEVADAVAVLAGLRGRLVDLAEVYHRIGAACEGYAGHLDAAHHAILAQLREFIEVSVAIEAAGGLFAFVTAGLSEVVAQGGEAAEIARVGLAIRSVLEILRAAGGAARAAMDAVGLRISEISARLEPILARHLEQAQVAAASDRGAIGVSRLPLRAEPATAATIPEAAAATTPEAAAVARLEESASIGPASETWGNQRTLAKHFLDHGADFGSASAEDYAREAALFWQRAKRERLPTKIEDNRFVRIFDPKTNTFGSYTIDGRTRTFFKPSVKDYWEQQTGTLQ